MREPAVAGRFYPAEEHRCREAIRDCVAAAEAETTAQSGASGKPGRAVGGVVPHAGWAFSGPVAAATIIRVLADAKPDTVVIFGAVHRRGVTQACTLADGTWWTPIREVAIDEALAQACVRSGLIEARDACHEGEHSIEVQVPFIAELAPGAAILPVLVPPTADAPHVGIQIAAAAESIGRRAAFLGSTDLTHYGADYGFTPQGSGAEGLAWAKNVNDRRIIELMLSMEAGAIVQEALRHHNACGPGAVAATTAASRALGAIRGTLLRHITSSEALEGRDGGGDMAVGYAAVVFEAP